MYELELDKILDNINKNGHKRVLIQLPDGLKPKGKEIINYLESKSDVELMIWFSSCYGACDIPKGLDSLNIDLLVQFGHNKFMKKEW